MPLYGDLDHVRQLLRPTADTDLGADADARLGRIQQAVSAALEDELGRTFGAPTADTTELFWAGRSPVVLFDRPARAITSVTVGGSVEGRVATGGTAYSSASWTPEPYDPARGLIYGLRLFSGGWWGAEDAAGNPVGPVVVVGDFSDRDDDGDVPDEIAYVADYLIAETFKFESASPAGFIGPDGVSVPIRNPWKTELVTRTLDKWRTGSREWVV